MIDEQVFILHPERVTIADSARIDRWVKLEGTVTIGEHVHIASFSHIGTGGGEVVFGKHSGCSSHVVICSGQPDLAFAPISAADWPVDQHPLRKRTVIGEYVVIFASAVICPGVTIGDFAVIGAGAIVTKDVPPYAVVVGNPGRVIGWRRIGQGGKFETVYLPKLRDLAAARDIERVREHYGESIPEQMAVDLVEAINVLTQEMA
jgi:acetyltransferase-like isoleucine patch superfamily enzyme